MPGQTFPLPFAYRAYPLKHQARTFPLDFRYLAQVFRRYVVILEIDFFTTTRGYSVEGVRAPQRFYSDQILNFGAISRESSSFGGEYTISDLTVKLFNRNQEFSKLAAEGPIYNRQVRAFFGDPDRGYARMTRIFTGNISGDWDISEGEFTFTAHDLAMDRYRTSVQTTMKTLLPSVFPYLPSGQEAKLVPVVYGECDIDPEADLASYDRGGPIPCYLIDPAVGQPKFRYVVDQHASRGVPRIFRYGLLMDPSAYAVTTATYDGRLMTILEFPESPVNPDRLTELEITASVQGKTMDGMPGGTLIENPLDQIADYFVSYGATPTAELHTLQFQTARDLAEASAYQGAWPILDNQLQHVDVLQKFSESFQCAIFPVKDGRVGFYLKTADSLPAPLLRLREEDLAHFQIRSNPVDDIATKIQYNYLYQWPRQFFEKQPQYDIPGEETSLGKERRINMDLWYVRQRATAEAIVLAAAELKKESVKYAEFELTPDRFKLIDLHSVPGITHYEGIAESGGYTNQPFRVVKLELTADRSVMKIGVLAASA